MATKKPASKKPVKKAAAKKAAPKKTAKKPVKKTAKKPVKKAVKKAAPKKAAAAGAKAATITVKQIAAELSETHDVPKRTAETMINDMVEIITKNLKKGNRIRLDVQPRDGAGRAPYTHYPAAYNTGGTNTIHTGGKMASYLLLPLIPPKAEGGSTRKRAPRRAANDVRIALSVPGSSPSVELMVRSLEGEMSASGYCSVAGSGW